MPKKIPKVRLPRGAVRTTAEVSDTGSHLTGMPPLAPQRVELIETYAARAPYSFARIIYDRDNAEYRYEVWEPQMNEREQELLRMLKDALNRTLEYEWEKMARKDKEQYLQEAIESFIKSRAVRLSPDSRDKLVYYLIREFLGVGPVQKPLDDPRNEGVSCDRP